MSTKAIKEIYSGILYICKCLGISVLHEELNGDHGSFKDDTIKINKKIKYTLEGIKTLAHELGHVNQFYSRKYDIFFGSERLKNTPENWRMVVQVEREASQLAKEFLKNSYGLDASFEELSKDIKIYYDLWKKEYFIQDN